jgi:hypothetical protein
LVLARVAELVPFAALGPVLELALAQKWMPGTDLVESHSERPAEYYLNRYSELSPSCPFFSIL